VDNGCYNGLVVAMCSELQSLNSSLTTDEAKAQIAELTKAVIMLFHQFLNVFLTCFSLFYRLHRMHEMQSILSDVRSQTLM